jgi:hypothetical protein
MFIKSIFLLFVMAPVAAVQQAVPMDVNPQPKVQVQGTQALNTVKNENCESSSHITDLGGVASDKPFFLLLVGQKQEIDDFIKRRGRSLFLLSSDLEIVELHHCSAGYLGFYKQDQAGNIFLLSRFELNTLDQHWRTLLEDISQHVLSYWDQKYDAQDK